MKVYLEPYKQREIRGLKVFQKNLIYLISVISM